MPTHHADAKLTGATVWLGIVAAHPGLVVMTSHQLLVAVGHQAQPSAKELGEDRVAHAAG